MVPLWLVVVFVLSKSPQKHENGDSAIREHYSASSEIAMVTGTLILVGMEHPLGLAGVGMGRRHFLKVGRQRAAVVEILRGVENTNSSIIPDLLCNAMAAHTIPILVGKHAWVVRTCLVWRPTCKDTQLRAAALVFIREASPDTFK